MPNYSKLFKTIFMKKYFTIFLFLLTQINAGFAFAQDEKPGIMFRGSDDNDFYNDRGKGTDDAYTNGTGFDVFYNKSHESDFFLDRWLPKAGDSSINTFGVGLMHVMYTPSDITKSYYQPNDYAWSAALYASHTLYSFNPVKKYAFITETDAGVMGPAALGKLVQSTVHHLIQDPAIPKGWDNQFGDDALINMSFTAEKELVHVKNFIEIIGSGKISAGTMNDELDLNPEILIGIMNPYFNGYMGHNNSTGSKKVQVYLKYKPGIQLVAWNSLLEGGMLDRDYTVKVSKPDINSDKTVDEQVKGTHPHIENLVAYTSYSLVIVYGRFSMSYSQTHNSELVKNTYSHTYGNITSTYSF